jgi:hypothetical protein
MATAKTQTLTAVEFNGDTGQLVVRDLTTDEIADREALMTQSAADKSAIEAKATARASALAKLAELGLTADEIAAL